MSSSEAYSKYLYNLIIKLPIYFTYFMPWIGLSCAIFACGALFLRKRTEDSIIIFLFKWQYTICVLYVLNMIFIDNQFSIIILNYLSTYNVADIVCKAQLIGMRFIYCLSPWMQVILTFDRLWSVYLRKTWYRRSRKSLSILILLVFGFVLLTNAINGWYYAQAFKIPVSVYNAALNKTVRVSVVVHQCYQANDELKLVQDMIYVTMRVVLPFGIMVFCNAALFLHIYGVRKRSGRTVNPNARRENFFTLAVWFTNAAFFVLNAPFVISTVLNYYYYMTGIIMNLDLVVYYKLSLLSTVALLLSYVFTLFNFWIDLVFNGIFRTEMRFAILILMGRRMQVLGESSRPTNRIRVSVISPESQKPALLAWEKRRKRDNELFKEKKIIKNVKDKYRY